MMRNIFCAAFAAFLLSACASDNIVAGSSQVFGVGGQTRPDGTMQAAIGSTMGDFVTVPLVVDDQGNEVAVRVKNVCGQENAVSVYGSIEGNANAGGGAGGANVSLNVGRGLSVGAASEYLTMATLAAATGQEPSFLYDCSKTLMDEKEYRNTVGSAPETIE